MLRKFAEHRQLNYGSIVAIRTKAGMKTFVCAYCETEMARQLGLMGQRLLPSHGAVLDFKSPTHISLWMKNCIQPLAAVFIQDGKVVHSCVMDHNDPNRLHHCPCEATLVLEVNPDDVGGIQVGDEVKVHK